MFVHYRASTRTVLTTFKALTSSYRCLVGVAPSIAGLEETESNVIQNKGFSTLVVTQPETTFFFVCIKEQIISHWPNRRTFTAANAEEEAMKIADMPVTNNVLFGEIWARRTRSYLCALEEGVLKHWFFKRTALLGDSVHKVSFFNKNWLVSAELTLIC